MAFNGVAVRFRLAIASSRPSLMTESTEAPPQPSYVVVHGVVENALYRHFSTSCVVRYKDKICIMHSTTTTPKAIQLKLFSLVSFFFA